MNIHIRKAIPGDGKAIMECMSDSCDDNCKKCINKYVCNSKFFLIASPDLIDKKLSISNGCTLIALEGEKVLGVSIYTIHKFSKMQHRAECGWFVRQGYMNKGIASMLVEALIKQAKKNKIKRLDAEASVNNKASLRVAEKLGFKIEGKREKGLLLDDGKYEDVFILGKLI